jgi:AcrR family transcriptional regulator
VSTAPPKARARNARGDGHALRGEIVDAARAILVEDGYESAVTLRGVARRVGIAAPSIYAHFAGPDEIVQAVTVETFAELGRYIATAKEGVDEPRERLLAGCRAYIAFGVDNPNLYGLLFRRNRLLHGDEPRPDDMVDERDPEAGPFGGLMDSIRRCIADGSSTATDVLSTAVQLWAAMHGLVLLRGNDYQFPWPDLAQTETELITSIAKLR